ncbi:hypothetical protein CSB07_01600 [Candidatus Gracilibacteria bacterium]|nr:MAG: hypothetical protein CSB07_01600 [Candidatus Gracilibacteria bacterium]PIE85799.1 MAG: hypothetical protein CSA08_00080 [Candidatus Gracilibacteria bacterium]
MNKKLFAFTIVELIVIITVLVILMGISFLSYSGYTKNSRDTLRVTDLKNIKLSLDASHDKTGKYPDVSSGTVISYKGLNAWTQGVFGESTFRNVEGINKIPFDPQTEKYYTYSLTNDKKEYELAAAVEGEMVTNSNFLNKTYAGIGDKIGTSVVVGRYNGKVLKVKDGTSLYLLAVPTIISGDLSLTNLEDIFSNKKFAYKGSNVIAGNYKGTEFNTDKTYDFNPIVYELYHGAIKPLTLSENERIILLRKMQLAYESTILEKQSNYIDFSNEKLPIDLLNPTKKVKQFSCFFVKNNIKNLSGCSENLTEGPITIPPTNSWFYYLDARSLFANGSIYSENWINNSCDTSSMSIVDLSPGLDVIPANLTTNTIYRLAPGSYRLSRSVNLASCSGIIGVGNVFLKVDNNSISSLLNTNNETNIIIDNIIIDGAYPTFTGNNYLIDAKTNNSTFNNIKVFNGVLTGIFVSGNFNTLNNILAYHNVNGIKLTGTSNITNNIMSYSNQTGLELGSSYNSTFSNMILFNNRVGIFHNISSNNTLSNLLIYNNSEFGMLFSDSSENNIYNDTRIYNNYNSISYVSSPLNNSYYGNYSIYSNDLNSNSLLAGVGHSLFADGSIDTFGASEIVIPSISGWDSFLKGAQSSYVRTGFTPNLSSVFSGKESYNYDSNIPNQSPVLKYYLTNIKYYGVDGNQYNTSKKVGAW